MRVSSGPGFGVAGLMFLSVLCAGSGCLRQPAPPVVRTPVPVPAAFAETGYRQWDNRWWQSFESPALNALVAKALQDNLSLRESLARVEESLALAAKSGAPLWPSLGAEGSASQLTQRAIESPLKPKRRITTESRQYAAAFTASYELDLWGRVHSQRHAAALSAAAAREEYDAAAIMLAGQVAEVWCEIVEQRAQLRLVEEQAATVGDYLELIELRFANGQAVATDVYGQRQQRASVRAREPLIRARLAVLEHRLAVLLGLPPQTPVALAGETLPVVPSLPETGLPADLLERRPDLRAARMRVAALDRQVAAAVADRLPAIRLTARYSDQAPHSADLFRNWLITLAANATAPILDGGARAAEVKRQRALRDAQLARYGQTILSAFAEVEDALALEAQQREHLHLLRAQLDAARQTLDSARQRYGQGVDDYLRVLTSLGAVLQLEQNLLTQEKQLVLYRVQLCKALGGSWRAPSVPVAEVLVAEMDSLTTTEDQP